MRCTLRVLLPAVILLVGSAGSTRADMILYSDTTNFSGAGYAAGGAAADGVTATSSSTAMLADDIAVGAGGAGATVTSFVFSVANFNAAAVSANVDIRFYSVGANGGVGTLLGGLNFAPISFAGGSTVSLFTYSATSLFVVPTSGLFYVGEFFTNDSSTATTAQLNGLGLGVFNPPTVGSSNDSFFQSSAGGSTNTSSNPSGGLVNFGGNPVANFGFSFNGTPLASVPEPGSVVLLGLGLGAVGIARRRRRA